MNPPQDLAPQPLNELWSLAGRVALVTGGANGIGAATAARMSEAGASVVIGDLDHGGAQALAKTMPTEALGVELDVSDSASVDAAVAATQDRFGAVDILVNNAGIYPIAPVLETTDETWARVLDVNVAGAFRCARAVGSSMATRGRGVIINLASIQAFRAGAPGLAAYTASKGAVVSLTQALAIELGPAGVRAVGVAPSMVDTPGTRAQADAFQSTAELADVVASFAARLPLRRIAAPDDVARVITFAASDMAAFVTGQTILVDGGHETT